MLTPLHQRMDEATEMYREYKEEQAKIDWHAPASDIPAIVHAFVGDRHLMTIQVAGRDEAISAAIVGRFAFGADAAILTIDAHMKSYATHEAFEAGVAALEPGELQRACHDEHACERGEISDVLIVNAIDRDRDLTRLVPYALSASDPHVVWTEESETLDSKGTGGLIIDALRDAWRKQPPDLSDEAGWKIKCGSIRMLARSSRAIGEAPVFAFIEEDLAMIRKIDPTLAASFAPIA